MPLPHEAVPGSHGRFGNTSLQDLKLNRYAGFMSTVSANTAVPPGEWLGQMAEAIDELLWICDWQTGHVLYANPAFERFWGSAMPMLMKGGEALLEPIQDDDRERMRQARCALDIDPCVEEYRVRQPGAFGAPGRIARLRERAFRTRAATGEDWTTHIARDISWQFDTTARLRAEINRRTDAERDLSDATQRLQALIASAKDAVITIDESSQVIDWNHAAERMFGWRRDEALGRHLTELIIPPTLRERHNAGIDRFLKQQTDGPLFNRHVETRALRRGGDEFDAKLSVWPVRTKKGYTFSSFFRDISRRKAAERALAESEAKYRKVVENVNEGILVTANGRILYANPRALVLTGLDEVTAKSRPFVESIHPDDRERVMRNHMRRLRGEAVENHYHFRVVHQDGQVRWLEISAVLFEWQNQPATLNFLTDVTQRRQIEQDVRAALARERELSELKSRFVAVASHEFRTPLAVILSSIELLDGYGARLQEMERKKIVGQIKNAVARMNKMVEQVLLTSRLESGGFAFEPTARSIPELLVQVATEMDQANVQASRIDIECDGFEEPRLVDAKLLTHILVNLLGNALKYSPPDSPITCSASADEDRLQLRVTDQGIGIPPADLPRLFDSFHRGGNVGHVAGTGIGLYVVKECVELHRGTIEVQSVLRQGTSFHISLHAPRVR
jgi:PAS domain S-box-containing protein